MTLDMGQGHHDSHRHSDYAMPDIFEACHMHHKANYL